jgi:hypothetical protein
LAHNKSPGPAGFSGEFYQFFWDFIKVPLKKLFDDFVNGKLDIGRLNYGTITLLPKCEDAMVIQKFRPICLMNTSLKIVTKGMNNRLAPMDEHIIDKIQTAFMNNRHIMEGVCVCFMKCYMKLTRKNYLGFCSKLILRKPTIM